MKKRLNLEELELSLPAIDEKNSKILLGGNDYDGGLDDSCRYCAQLTFGESDSNSRGGNSGNNRGGQDDHDYGEEGNDYGDNFDLDVSIDGYHDYDGGTDGDGGGSSTGGTGTGNTGINIPASLSDGFNLSNPGLVLSLTDGNQAFNAQFEGILSSNSVIGELLNSVTQGNYQLMINTGNIINPTTGAVTNDTNISSGIQTITFDTSLITATGTANVNSTDNIGINHDNLNPVESLVAIIAHEAFHASSNMAIELASLNASTPAGQMNWLLNNGYSQDIVNIYFTISTSGGVQTITANDHATATANEHAYMSSSSFTLVNDAIAEYQSDVAQAIETRANLLSALSQAAANLGSGVSPDGGQGPGPTNEQLQEAYNNLANQLQDFLHDNGWLLP